MSWLGIALSVNEAYATKRNLIAQAKAAEQNNAIMEHLHRTARVKPAIRNAHKCPGCGSHEFRLHAGRNICVYCRITT